MKSLQKFLKMDSLEGKTFLDVGAGTGIYSLAALRLGATATSFDFDDKCVACCEELKKSVPNPEMWTVKHGSILDSDFVKQFPQQDIVYCWGVAHHTGNMWQAIENLFSLVKPNGLLYLAIYNKADGLAIYPDGRIGSSRFWQKFKRFYSSLPAFIEYCIDAVVMSLLVLFYLATLRNPIKEIRGHRDYFSKGMSWRLNIRDWLGGYPYEYASVAEIFTFAHDRGFTLENLTCNNGLLNNEFLLYRSSHVSDSEKRVGDR